MRFNIMKRKDDESNETGDRSLQTKQEAGVQIFEITGSGPVQEYVEYEEGTTILVIDCSSSMAGGAKLEQAKNGIIDFARNALRKHYRVGLIAFSDGAQYLCEPSRNLDNIKEAIERLYASGSTNMADAISLAKDNLKKGRIKDPRAIVIATDGEPNSKTAALLQAGLAKKNGVDIIAIGTDDADRAFLKKLASRSDLAEKVSQTNFGTGIAQTANKLTEPKRHALTAGKK